MADEAERSIEELIRAYARSASRGRPSELATYFTADGSLELPGMDPATGAPAIRERLSDVLARVDVRQVLLDVDIQVDVERGAARSDTVVLEHVSFGRAPGRALVGCYDDDLILTTAGWRFRRRRLAPMFSISGSGEA
jgi:hypothetical protein